MNNLRELVNEFSNDELFEHVMSNEKSIKYKLHGDPVESDIKWKLSMFSYHAHKLSGYVCDRILNSLYDQDGEPITTRKHLNNVLDRWSCNYVYPNNNDLLTKNIYLVPADVHF